MTRVENSPGQFFWGFALGLGLMVGVALLFALIAATGVRDNKIWGGMLLGSGPLMVLITILVARSQSVSLWVGALAALVPGLLCGVFIGLAAAVSG
jgi:hypothetical protein